MVANARNSAPRQSASLPRSPAGDPRLTESITSRDNRWFKRFRAALAGGGLPRETDGRTPLASAAGSRRGSSNETEIAGIEGLRLVETALASGVQVVAVLFSESGAKHLPRLAGLIPAEARVLRTSDRLFAQAATTEMPQGVAALVIPRVATFDDLIRGVALVLVLAGVQDPGNVGVLVRSAEAFGATGVATSPAGGIGTANPFGPKALRASAGSALRVPVLRGVGTSVVLAQLRVAGVKIYAACAKDSAAPELSAARPPLAPWEVDWRAPSALLLGNEGSGLPPELVRSADAIVRIPQAQPDGASERMDSLNVSVAGAVLLYEAARQRGLH